MYQWSLSYPCNPMRFNCRQLLSPPFLLLNKSSEAAQMSLGLSQPLQPISNLRKREARKRKQESLKLALRQGNAKG